MNKKMISALVSAVMLGSIGANTAYAVEAAPEKTYNYVALGDSIAAGFGLAGGNIAEDPALVITEELLANPVKGAYPYVFTEKLKEFAQDRGYSVRGTNLASTAYRAEDIENTIRIPGNKGQFASTILDTYLGEGASEALTPYHDYYTKYLSEADLVSIQLGGNDIIMTIVPKMVFGENPVLRAAGTALMLTLFGMDSDTALAGGMQVLEENKDTITTDDFIEAASFMYNVSQSADELVSQSAEHVKVVVEAVKEVNGEADIALIGMFNPYRTESSIQMSDDVLDVLGQIYNKAADAAADAENLLNAAGQQSKAYIDTLSAKVDKINALKVVLDSYGDSAELNALMAALAQCDDLAELAELIAGLSDSTDPAVQAVVSLLNDYDDIEELKTALSIVNNYDDIGDLEGLLSMMAKYRTANDSASAKAMAAELAGPMAMTMAGKNVGPQMQHLNSWLKDIAEDTGATYIDVYNISPEDDFDPHPNLNGHKEIADLLFDGTKSIFDVKMPAPATEPEQPSVEPEPVTKVRPVGDLDGDGIITRADVALLTAHVVGLRPLTADQLDYADIDRSGNVDMLDVLMLSTYVTYNIHRQYFDAYIRQ